MKNHQSLGKGQIGSTFLLLLSTTSIHLFAAGLKFPAYSQQCRDDAGPPFGDDSETFGSGGRYHDGSAATPVVPDDGNCPSPLSGACESTGKVKQAYIEGPIDCGGNGWYCRIYVQENWPPENLIADLNFGLCNTTEGFGDHGWDGSGHCHGSDDDSTYYWWMRDHWHRGYNGRLRCCCGWFTGGSDPVTAGRIANRCDYRRLVVDENDANSCRDANEDHGMGFDDIGCDQKYASDVGKPLEEDDSQCWELHNFGYSERGGGNGDGESGDGGSNDGGENSESGDGGNGEGDESDGEGEGGCWGNEEEDEEEGSGSGDGEEEDEEEGSGSGDGEEEDEEEGSGSGDGEEEDRRKRKKRMTKKEFQEKVTKYLRAVIHD